MNSSIGTPPPLSESLESVFQSLPDNTKEYIKNSFTAHLRGVSKQQDWRHGFCEILRLSLEYAKSYGQEENSKNINLIMDHVKKCKSLLSFYRKNRFLFSDFTSQEISTNSEYVRSLITHGRK